MCFFQTLTLQITSYPFLQHSRGTCWYHHPPWSLHDCVQVLHLGFPLWLSSQSPQGLWTPVFKIKVDFCHTFIFSQHCVFLSSSSCSVSLSWWFLCCQNFHILMYSLPHHHIEAKCPVGLIHNPLFGLRVQFQFIHPASVKLLEAFVTVDAFKLIKVETLARWWELQCPLCHFLEDLSAWEVAHVAGVGVGHQQHWVLLSHLVDAVHVGFGACREADLWEGTLLWSEVCFGFNPF